MSNNKESMNNNNDYWLSVVYYLIMILFLFVNNRFHVNESIKVGNWIIVGVNLLFLYRVIRHMKKEKI